ncbi:hypothetical protein GIB67_025556 [Kingdonia uniflora]|uniref:Uncharacterized protein n=1 Tax=Kingdonia uniflora TaxID=39325 RepID=A0A7J7M0G4_9MAGN|nr:hypothetical protein GIB67_025556 [Kingdonia uniflora]
MRAKFVVKSGSFSTITKGSSIWAGVRGALEDVHAHSGWVIGDGACIDLWRDNWCSSFSKDMINNDDIPWTDLHAKVSCIITEGRWSIPNNLQLIFHRFGVDIHNIKINKNKNNRRVWKPHLVSNFLVKGALIPSEIKVSQYGGTSISLEGLSIQDSLCRAGDCVMGRFLLMTMLKRKALL